jgi:RNA polymerase sigma-70 factor (ECF subfamily)
MDEQALIASCQAGRLEDFDPLYTAYVKRIYAYVYRRVLDRQIAEDIVSITFMKALEGIKSFDARKGNFSSWIYRIARNAMTDHFRAAHPTDDIDAAWDLSSDDDVEKDVKLREQRAVLRDALKTLDANKREIVLLRIWEDLSYKEIAAITGKSEANCKMIFSRAVASLRTTLPLAAFLLLFFPHQP